jgi:hypothetical protein
MRAFSSTKYSSLILVLTLIIVLALRASGQVDSAVFAANPDSNARGLSKDNGTRLDSVVSPTLKPQLLNALPGRDPIQLALPTKLSLMSKAWKDRSRTDRWQEVLGEGKQQNIDTSFQSICTVLRSKVGDHKTRR